MEMIDAIRPGSATETGRMQLYERIPRRDYQYQTPDMRRRLDIVATMPAKPIPRSTSVDGSGTGAGDEDPSSPGCRPPSGFR